MEAFLQFWVYDQRWAPIIPHKPLILHTSWLIPIASQLSLNVPSYLQYGKGNTTCLDPEPEEVFYEYLTVNALITFLTVITLIRQLYLARSNKLFPPSIQFTNAVPKEATVMHDYWFRRNALISVNAWLLLVLVFSTGLFSGANLIYLETSVCTEGMELSIIHAWISRVFLIMIGLQIVTFLVVKGASGLFLAFCPQQLVRCKKTFCRKKSKYDRLEERDIETSLNEVRMPLSKSPQEPKEPLLYQARIN
ncbi:hypothetical protein FGO68_gene8813 [Halteria grandinella]|uniref:Uncharacterized protein n=1 Tax=Halteria grandinella TaxID=5974 RepID=A0A8J8SZQ9_HALGN|nr:hypothetical protein FGO68_gene8813 [Halteria grandinella]